MDNLKEILKEMFDDNVDGVTFLPSMDFDDVEIKGFNYNTKSKYEVNHLGNDFHIILYRCSDTGMIIDNDLFVATLTDPYVYVHHIITCGFFGIVSKKTKRSSKFIKDIYKTLIR